MPAAVELLQLLVREMAHHFPQFWILAEEVLADVIARHDDILLILAVNHFGHALGKQSGVIFIQKRVPQVAPDHLNDIPARAAERSL